MRANVIDMSHHNSWAKKQPDFPALKSLGIHAIIHKASQGLHFRDQLYTDRRHQAQDAGLLWGAYHFLDSTDPEKQAENFLEASGAINPAFDLEKPIMLAADYEPNGDNTPALHQLQMFVRAVERHVPNTSVVIYSGNLIRETLIKPKGGHVSEEMRGAPEFFAAHRLWLAQYGPTANIPWPWNDPDFYMQREVDASLGAVQPIPEAPGAWLWQYSERGKVPPLVGSADLNFFDGTINQLAANWST